MSALEYSSVCMVSHIFINEKVVPRERRENNGNLCFQMPLLGPVKDVGLSLGMMMFNRGMLL